MSAVKERIQKWDILKFVLIFFVVFGHISEQYSGMNDLYFFIYSFHMPLFIFVSGLFSKKTINEKRYDKIFTYFVLYIFIKAILCVSGFFNKGAISFRVFEENGVPWYAFAIFAFSLITVFLRNLDKKYVFVFSIILACFAGYDTSLSNFLVISRIIVFFPFFYAGYSLDANTVAEKLNKKYIKVIAVLFIAAYLIFIYMNYDMISFLRPLLSGKHPFWILKKFPGYGIFFRFGYYILTFVLGALIISLIPNKLGKGFIAGLGSRSVQVYALHYVFIHLLYQNFNIDALLQPYLPISTKVIILPLSIVVILICSSKLWTPIFDLVLKPGYPIFKKKTSDKT